MTAVFKSNQGEVAASEAGSNFNLQIKQVPNCDLLLEVRGNIVYRVMLPSSVWFIMVPPTSEHLEQTNCQNPS